MRLNRLDLTRYGRFKDAQIVMPLPKADTPDVTVIYGPNEAGKSTAFTAYLELLFGMKARDHPYEFRFKRSDLLVGAELDVPNLGPVVLQRNSKRAQSLLDDQGQPIDETFLTAALHGLGRDHYVERFSLNDEGLRKGGARIAGAQGDLGQLLHAGVSGLATIAATLDQMTARADQFHKKGGRGTALKVAKDRLSEIGQQLRASRLTPERERALAEARDKAQAGFDAADTDLGNARLREAACKAAQTWYDRTEDMRLIELQLEEFPDGPDLRKGATEAVARLVAVMSEKSLRVAEAEAAFETLSTVVAKNPEDPLADALAGELERLDQLQVDGAPLLARAATAVSDLDNRIADRDALSGKISQILTGLGLGDVPVNSLVLSAGELDELAAGAQAVVNAQKDMLTAADALARAKDQQGAAQPEPQDLSQLQAAWEAWQTVADISVAESAVASEKARLATLVSGLPATWPELLEAGLPVRETLNDLASSLVTTTADVASAKAELEKHDTDYGVAQAKRQADEATPAAVDATATAQARRTRDETWVVHRKTLSPETASAFETAMHVDDDTQASFAAGADARGQLATSRREEAAARASRDKAQERLASLTKTRQELLTQSAAFAAMLGLSPETNPSAFAERHTVLLQAAELAAALKNATAEFDVQRTRRLAVRANMAASAKAVGINSEDSDLPSRVHTALTLQDSARQSWQRWAREQQAITELEAKAEQATSHKEAADQTLAALTNTLPLSGRTAADIIVALPALRNLAQLQAKHAELVERIEALENAIVQLDASAMRIKAMEGEEDLEAISLAVIEQARNRLTSAERATNRRTDAEVRHAEETKARKLADDAIAEAEVELSEWFKDQGASDLTPAARVAMLTERDTLRSARNAHDTARNSTRAAVKLDIFEEELVLLPDATRGASVQQLLDDAQAVRDLALGAHREAIRLYQEAFDADDRSDLATEQATILEELRSNVRQAAISRLGVLAAKGALRRLASERRTTMLRDVEDAFVAITAPAWSSVDVWSQTEGEKLVGVQPDGSSVPVEDMSTGTMGQLYFALRVAGYRSFARDLGPLPMILDDIMETFDDDRAKAALQLCSDIGRSGQAIIFTHHAHLVELARVTIPSVNIVDMPC
jgi:chromosome segregation protein